VGSNQTSACFFLCGTNNLHCCRSIMHATLHGRHEMLLARSFAAICETHSLHFIFLKLLRWFAIFNFFPPYVTASRRKGGKQRTTPSSRPEGVVFLPASMYLFIGRAGFRFPEPIGTVTRSLRIFGRRRKTNDRCIKLTGTMRLVQCEVGSVFWSKAHERGPDALSRWAWLATGG
jgi:hypothetical protein